MEQALLIIGIIVLIGVTLFFRKVLKTLGELEDEYKRRSRWDD